SPIRCSAGWAGRCGAEQAEGATMHPALSVILFTTLSGAGYGLLTWLGVSLFMLHARADLMPSLQPMYVWRLLAGLALSPPGRRRPWGGRSGPRARWGTGARRGVRSRA